eukprot:scaffold10296_cov84-Skeletonema_marinoi.AAC.3
MDDATFTSDTAAMNSRSLLEQLVMISSLLRKDSSADDDAAAARNRNVVEGRAKEGVRLINDQMADVSTELLLTVMSDMMLLRLLDGLRLEEGRAVSSDTSSSDEQLEDDAAAAKKKKKRAAAAAKKKRNKQNKAAAKHKKINLMPWSWLGGGIISLIMMVQFSSITTLIFPLSLIHQSDGSGDGKAPPALPPSASKSLRQEDLTSDNVDVPNIISSPVAAVVPPPVFSSTAVAVINRGVKMKEEKSAALFSSPRSPSSPTMPANPTQSCVDTPGWKDNYNNPCDWYKVDPTDRCGTGYVNSLWKTGSAIEHCCICEGGSYTCEDLRSQCQKYIKVLGIKDGFVSHLCGEAESFCCEDAGADHDIVINTVFGSNQTVGLYNECKCGFWSRLCEGAGVGEACDYAAEYCCGDYMDYEDVWGFDWGFFYLESPQCYCDFFNYAQREFGHTLKSKALNTSQEIANPCGQFQDLRTYVLALGILKPRLWIERGSLVSIYTKTNGQNWTKKDGWDTSVDYCQWYGISCDVDGYVTSINLRNNNLEGQFPVYTGYDLVFQISSGMLNRQTLPSNNEVLSMLQNTWLFQKFGLVNLYNLKSLDLAENKLTGTIDYRPLYNLQFLSHFDVSGNQLSGDLDALVTTSLTHADFSSNSFTSLRFKKYKGSLQTLRFCDVSNNVIQNNVANILENIPPNTERFFISSNRIYGTLSDSFNNIPKLREFNIASNSISGSLPDSLNSLRELRQVDISSNALSGKLPSFADSFATLEELDLSNQARGFTGSIPDDVWRSLSLKVLNLAGNRLTGTIPSLVGNLAVLEMFDLSNNAFLSGTIPSQMGLLDGSLKRLFLSNNTFTGTIPFQVGQLEGASIMLKDNGFNTSTTAPRSLCMLVSVKEFDLADDTILCPPERNALSDFYDVAKGAEWTDGTNWRDEYASYCEWKGVTCNGTHVTKLNLTNNGLSGRMSERIGNLTFIKVLDLSDNNIKGSIPAELGKLSKLVYLRLSYNAFTGAAPEGLAEMKGLQLLQLQSNRITELPIIPQLDESFYKNSTFVTDCGVPSAFDEALKCEHCTMCCKYH